jgi:hypothetical protein
VSAADDAKTACECCQGTAALTPVFPNNRPGLSALAYRVGTHARFKETMLAEISAKAELRKLTTRENDDPTIAMLDAWAVTLDVLSFYQERIANEGFLRTATERRSLLELARTIGYELRPGVASSTWLAFTLDGSPGSPREVAIPAGTRAQSLPTKTELPQSFETGEPLLARPEWNALRPRQMEPQTIGKGTSEVLLAGLATQLRPGDALLVLWDQTTSNLRILSAVETRSKEGVTLVTLENALDKASSGSPKIYALRQRAAFFGANAPDWKATTVDFQRAYSTSVEVAYDATRQEWPDMPASGTVSQIDLDAAYPRIAPESWFVLASTETAVFQVNRVAAVSRAKFSLSARVTQLSLENGKTVDLATFGVRQTAVFAESEELRPALKPIEEPMGGKEIALEGLVGGLVRGRALIVQGRRMRVRVDGGSLELKAENGSSEVTAQAGETLVVLAPPTVARGAVTWRLRDRDGFEGIVTLTTRGLRFDLRVFTRGPRLTLVPAEADDPFVAEAAVLEKASSDKERTTLELEKPLANLYDRTTVSVLANAAPATHGETRREVLGGGDAARRFQRFRLRQKPLTYVAAPVAGGGESTLQIRVNGVLWHEAPNLLELGPRDRKYVLRRDDESSTTVQFGDGVHGARLPSGIENVEGVYRKGIGLPGLVGEEGISLLATRPLGVKSVTNPVPATGAADPELRDQARRNAPITVLTLDRIVSLRDFEDFARSFSGIGKAQARTLWDRGTRLVHLTVAAAGGRTVDPGSALYKNLRAAMDRLRDPFQALRIESFDPLPFQLGARVRIDPDHPTEAVLERVRAALSEAFSSEAREFGQSVFLSEVMAVIQRVEGVVYVDVETLHLETQGATLEDRILALPARIDDAGKVQEAQLLTLSPKPVTLEAIP